MLSSKEMDFITRVALDTTPGHTVVGVCTIALPFLLFLFARKVTTNRPAPLTKIRSTAQYYQYPLT